MPFITFIYRIENNTFYGKYVFNYISDDHEGLDIEITPTILDGINEYRKQKGLEKINKISIGILSFSTDECIPTHSSDEEIHCFDFYHKKYICKKDETYVNGKRILPLAFDAVSQR